MMDEFRNNPKRFSQSKFLVWAALILSNAQMFAMLMTSHPMAGEVYLAGVPTTLALAGAWTGITNWAEVRRP